MSAPSDRTGRVKRLPFLAALALTALCVVAPALAYVFEVTDDGTPIFWQALRDNPPGALQFTYHAQGSARLGGPLGSNPALKSALDEAITRWSTVGGATVRFHPALVSADTGVTNDGVNRVIFTSQNAQDFLGPDGPYIVGLTTTSFMPSTGVLVDADMQFNDTSAEFALTMTEKTGTVNGHQQINLKDVVTHETGHALGLDHSHVKGSTMYFAASEGATNLTVDDAAGISVLYPSSTFAATTGSITGKVTRGGAGVFGIHVACIDVATGKVTVAAFTASDGRYVMKGVPPGRYIVIAESMKPNALGSFFELADTSMSTLLVHAPSPSAPPAVILVRPTIETSGVDLRTEDARTDPDGGASKTTAIPFELGTAQARRLVPGSASRTADFYSFPATSGTTVTINVTSHRLWVPSNPTLEVYDSAGNLVAGPSANLSAGPVDLDDRLVFSPPLDGTQNYVLKVRAAAASSASFPDPRSVKEAETMYLLTTKSVRANRPPQVVSSAALTGLTTSEAGDGRGAPISVPLTGVVTDEEPLSSLSWVATNVPTDLYTVDASALAADPPVLKITPRAYRSGQGTFTLMVFDTDDASASIPITVTVSPINDPPLVRVDGGSQTARGGPRLITLDGSTSRPGPVGDSAENNQPMTFAWTQLAGPVPVTSTGASSNVLKVLMRDAGIYRFQLTGTETGEGGLVGGVTQDVTVDNLPPQPRALAPKVAVPGQLVRVRGDLSSDPNEPLTTAAFDFALIAPVGASVATTREATASMAFTAPTTAGRYVFEMAVTDSGFRELDGQRSNPLTVRTTFAIDVRAADDLPPTADAGAERVVATGDLVTLDGRDSIGAAGEAITYAWTTDESSPVQVGLTNPTVAQPSFTAPTTPGVYAFNLVVRGSRTGLDSAPVRARVRVVSQGTDQHAPVARVRLASATAATPPAPGDRLLLDGTASGDPDGSLVSYQWTQVGGPSGSLSSNTGSTPSFVPPAPGLYRFSLVVSDGVFASRPALLSIPVRPAGAAEQKLIVSARQPSTAATYFTPPAELRFVVDGTTAAANAVELTARLESGAPIRTVVWEQISGPRLPVSETSDGTTLVVLPRQARVHTFRVTAILPDGQEFEQVVHVLADRSTSRIPRATLTERAAVDVIIGNEVELDGSPSRDLPPAGGEEASSNMVYYWEQEDGPPVTLRDSLAAHPVFVPPMTGRYAFRLRVDNQRFGTLSAPSNAALVAEVRAKVAMPAATGTDTPITSGGHSGGCAMTRPDARASWDLTPILWAIILAVSASARKQRTPGQWPGARELPFRKN